MKKFDISLKAIEPLFEKAGNISKVHRILICVATFIVITGLFVYFLYLPNFENLKQLNSEYKSLEQRLASAKKKAAQLNKYREEMKIAEAQYKIAMRALPDKKEISSLLTSIAASGNDAGLEFLLFNPETEINKDFYAEIPVSITVSGNYHNVGLFFDKISRLPRIVNIKNILMAVPQEFNRVSRLIQIENIKNKDVQTSLTREGKVFTECTSVTYRFVETEEKDAANTAKKK